jgi:predicted protein tyrosine phosphatase
LFFLRKEVKVIEVIIHKECKQDLDKWEIQHRAINQVITICSGIPRLAGLLGLQHKGQSRISKWRNQCVKIPLEYAIVMEYLTQVSVKRLCPFIEEKNYQTILRWRSAIAQVELLPINVPCNKIVIQKDLLVPHQADRPIILSTDLVLISGIELLAAHRAAGKEWIAAWILDLESCLAGTATFAFAKVNFLMSEWAAISFRLKQLKRQRSDLWKSQLASHFDKNMSSFCRNRDKITVRTDQKIATMVGFKNKDALHRALQVCQQGIPELVESLNHQRITLSRAAKISKLPPQEQQLTLMAIHLKKKETIHE